MTQSTDLVALVRTLASGHVPATIQVSRRASGAGGPHPVRHALDRAGSPLLLTAVDSPADRALTGSDDYDVATVLAVPAPDGGQLWISGWSTRLRDPLSRAAVLEFAARHPLADLLDVGVGHVLHRMDVAEVHLELPDGRWIEIDPEEYAAA
ncbi:hypothetical protein [Asanoa iriomotensis]|uniref:Pyridoxamine 5'-phosphate oxidase n=1 Tax=Asanoa iriomotensis TaxID=234613 RepID=A0ABQ4BYL0_9ACTN|nr:hypothetical protein [Asanoa iriomotensis]GIF55604.1 hypothetical protein Air01nite_16990 [Asanoa iriomotensis]